MQFKTPQIQDIKDVRVAAVIQPGKIVINKGSNDGVVKSMEFVIFEQGPDIIDPISKKSLGKLENVKGEFKVFHIQDSITTLLSKKTINKTLFESLAAEDTEITLIKSVKEGDCARVINISYNYE
ncbi:MAG: hypothetical protein SNG27_01675 [Rikenellaceae bacterium]